MLYVYGTAASVKPGQASLPSQSILFCIETMPWYDLRCRELTPGWIRVFGTLAGLFGAYYIGAAHGEVSGTGLKGFYMFTVAGRLALSAIFVLLRITQQATGNGLIVLAALNAAGALSMLNALNVGHSESQPAQLFSQKQHS